MDPLSKSSGTAISCNKFGGRTVGPLTDSPARTAWPDTKSPSQSHLRPGSVDYPKNNRGTAWLEAIPQRPLQPMVSGKAEERAPAQEHSA